VFKELYLHPKEKEKKGKIVENVLQFNFAS
jgi:hypothetical protein